MFKALYKFPKYTQLVCGKIAFESRSISFQNLYFNHYTLKCLQLWPWSSSYTSLHRVVLLWGLYELAFVKHSGWFLVQSKLSIKYNLEIIIIFCFYQQLLVRQLEKRKNNLLYWSTYLYTCTLHPFLQF